LGGLYGPYNCQNPLFAVANHAFSDNVACAHGGSPIELRRSYFFFPLSFLSYVFEIHVNPFKK
jgi:hypothetical protein